MSISRLGFTYPRTYIFRFNIVLPAGTANGASVTRPVIKIGDLRQVQEFDIGSGLNLVIDGIQVGGIFDPAIEKLSFAAVKVVTPANIPLRNLIVNGGELGVGNPGGATNFIFAENFTTFLIGAVAIRANLLTNPMQPEAFPFFSITGTGRNETGVALGADQTITIDVLLWVTPRKDLV